ncbi:MAG TPA: HAD hydrolase family protein [Gemmatimonadales bacterium]|jgi:3-deoxy-D-manno-octulosonate 8-phosphate phosphatase (KDO 8-P phosphatase)|nr:HAD hydrolase family protein [Gemmatimonadales bacterium]
MIDPALAGRIKLLALDVDGVLTNNAIYVSLVGGQRVEFKQFDIQDGLALGLARRLGLVVAWVSGRYSDATTLRAAELKIDEVIQDRGARKVPAMTDMLLRRGIGWDEVAFLGDDLADVPVLRRVALPMAVANAVDEVKALAVYVTRSPGGAGAVREAVEALLRAQGRWQEAVRVYLEDRGEQPEPATGTGRTGTGGRRP